MTGKQRIKGKRSSPVPYSNTFGAGYGGLLKTVSPNNSRDRKVVIERMYVRILTELAVNRFKWEGLPETVDERFLELTLFSDALCVFYDDPEYGYLALKGAGEGDWNMYNTPTSYRVYGNRFVNRRISARQCVPIWDNRLRIPASDVVHVYATRLAELDRTIEINGIHARVPYLITANEQERLSYENAIRQLYEGQPAVFATTTFNADKIQVFPGYVPENGLVNLSVLKSKIWNECMTLLGINNANQDKRERLVASEVDANDDQVESSRSIALRARKDAADKINRKYPELAVSVDWAGQDAITMDYFEKGGEIGGDVHPDTP